MLVLTSQQLPAVEDIDTRGVTLCCGTTNNFLIPATSRSTTKKRYIAATIRYPSRVCSA